MAEFFAAAQVFFTAAAPYITAASIAYQVTQARKMRKAAQAAAEARKGYELVVEGEGVTLPIVYGRAKIGGVRAYHNTSSNYVYTTPNSDKVFTNPQFNNNINGEKNEFLFFQQALCQGPISNVYDVVYDESRYSDDPELNSTSIITHDAGYSIGDNWVYDTYTETLLKSGSRIDLHYGDSAVADTVMAANHPERVNSVFTQVKNGVGLAYASVVIKLDRDDPAFSNVPMLQFFIEGKKVKNITRSGTVGAYTYSINPTRTYSNNPALCLLDYLLDNTSGKNIDASLIDLESFYNAKVICDQIVLQDATVGGKIYFPTNGGTGAEGITPSSFSRDIRLYECNAIIDTQKPLRENVESILSTMGDARLVWSAGKYKLNLQYPANNAAIVVAADLTDSDLILDNTVTINWPTSSERLNQCIVRFHNESENFKEDTASWPPKVSGTSLRGVGGFKYPIAEEKDWPDNAGGILLKKYAVWSGAGSTFDQTWKFFVKEAGTFTLEYTADNSCSIQITTVNGTIVFNGSHNDWNTTNTGTVTLLANTEYRIRIQASDYGGGKGAAAKLSKGSFIYWTTRSENYSGLVTIVNDASVFNQMKAEDNGLDLETDIFADGVTDYYHALAKAEELVRVSRSAFGIQFKYVIKDKFLEPGDFIRLNSKTLNLGLDGELYLRVNEVKITEESVCEVNATRFDSTQLAWNVNDNEYIKTPNVYNFVFGAPTGLAYAQQETEILNSSGKLTWNGVDTSALDTYITYYYIPGNLTVDNQIIWTELGRTTDTTFNLPPLTISNTIFGVRALSKAGKLSNLATTTVINFEPAVVIDPYTLVLSNDSLVFTCDSAGTPTTGQLPKTITLSMYRGMDLATTGVGYSIVASGCTATVSGNIITISAIAAQYASIAVTSTIAGKTISRTITLAKAFAGVTGNPGNPGTNGNQSATPTLYQWSTTTPANPSGQSTFTWDSAVNSSYTGGNGWSTTIPTNPGTPLIQLWTATKPIVAVVGTTTSTVSWTSGYTISSVTANGANGINGLQNARPVVYQWALTLPAGPTGTSVYTWANSSFTPTPSGWSTSITASPSAGFTLWAATVNLSDSSTVSTSTINWTTASIIASGYAGVKGDKGDTGNPGNPGNQGASARIAYTKTTLGSLAGTPATITTVGGSSYPPNDSWGSGTVWQATPPAITAGESVYQSDGIYDPVTGNTVWNVPYLSALKVGSLSAITTNTGNLTVSGTIQSSNAAISDTTMTGSGAVIYSNGQFAVGNSSTNITFNGSLLSLNGQVVVPSNIDTRNLTIKDSAGNVIFGSGTNLDYSRITASSGWLNNNITISGGAINGIGTGNNTAVANTLISIGSDGVLSGAGGGTVSATGISAVHTNLSNAPAAIKNDSIVISAGVISGIGTGSGTAVANNAITISGNAINGIGTGSGTAVANSAISISSDGTLSGAGGGTVTASGLGAVRTDLANAPAGILNSNVTLGTLGAGGFAYLSQITSANVSTYISGAAIGTAQIGVLTAGNIGAGTIDAGKIAAGTIWTNNLQVGSSPEISGTSMSGSGAKINSNGTFALGNSSTNISFNGGSLYLNGNVVATGNINSNAVTNTPSAFTLADFVCAQANTWEDAQTLTFALSGNPVYVSTAGNTVYGLVYNGEFNFESVAPFYRIVRTTFSGGFQELIFGGTDSSMAFSDQPPAGTYTYRLQVYTMISQGQEALSLAGVSNRSLILIETKR